MSLKEAPMLLMRTYAFMPKVEGNKYEKQRQNAGTFDSGHDTPDKNSMGTEMNTNSMMQSSLL